MYSTSVNLEQPTSKLHTAFTFLYFYNRSLLRVLFNRSLEYFRCKTIENIFDQNLVDNVNMKNLKYSTIPDTLTYVREKLCDSRGRYTIQNELR